MTSWLLTDKDGTHGDELAVGQNVHLVRVRGLHLPTLGLFVLLALVQLQPDHSCQQRH